MASLRSTNRRQAWGWWGINLSTIDTLPAVYTDHNNDHFHHTDENISLFHFGTLDAHLIIRKPYIRNFILAIWSSTTTRRALYSHLEGSTSCCLYYRHAPVLKHTQSVTGLSPLGLHSLYQTICTTVGGQLVYFLISRVNNWSNDIGLLECLAGSINLIIFVSDEKISSCFGAPFPYYYFDTYFACPREHRWWWFSHHRLTREHSSGQSHILT